MLDKSLEKLPHKQKKLLYDLNFFIENEEDIQELENENEMSWEAALTRSSLCRMSKLGLSKSDDVPRGVTCHFVNVLNVDIEILKLSQLKSIIKEQKPTLNNFDMLVFNNPVNDDSSESLYTYLDRLKLIDSLSDYPQIEITILKQKHESDSDEEMGFYYLDKIQRQKETPEQETVGRNSTFMIVPRTQGFLVLPPNRENNVTQRISTTTPDEESKIDFDFLLRSRSTFKMQTPSRRRQAINKVLISEFNVIFNDQKCVLIELLDEDGEFKVVSRSTNQVLLWSRELSMKKEVDGKIITLEGDIFFSSKEDFEEFCSHRSARYTIPEERLVDHNKSLILNESLEILPDQENFMFEIELPIRKIFNIGLSKIKTSPGYLILQLIDKKVWWLSINDEDLVDRQEEFPLSQVYQFVYGGEMNGYELMSIVLKRRSTEPIKILFPQSGLMQFIQKFQEITDANKFDFPSLFVVTQEQFDQQRQFQLEAKAYKWLDEQQLTNNDCDKHGLVWIESETQDSKSTDIRVMTIKIHQSKPAIVRILISATKKTQIQLISRETAQEKVLFVFSAETVAEVFQSPLDNRRLTLILNEAQEFSLVFATVSIKHVFMALLNFKGSTQDQLRIRLVSWNQARDSQTILGNKPLHLMKQVQFSDVIAFTSQECRREFKATRISELETFMLNQGFENIGTFCEMWEMFIVIFVKKDLRKEIQDIKKCILAKGKFGYVGNKGCVAYSFVMRDRVFNFIACHLQHGQDKIEKRNKMAAEILKELQLHQSMYKDFEIDSASDFTFFFGDLNYRMDSTFNYLSQHLDDCLTKQLELDQLHQQRQLGIFPLYQESKIEWLPTYKLSKNKANVYMNKKDQAPSYCDRILYKNNSCVEIKSEAYEAYHDVLGSDHRPVSLTLLMEIPRYQFYDVNSDKTACYMEVGSVKLTNLDLPQMFRLKEKIKLTSFQVAVQFSGSFIELDAQILYSEIQQVNATESEIQWEYRLPILKTAVNALNLLKSRALQMLIWGKQIEQGNDEFRLIGQTVFKLKNLKCNLVGTICMSNQVQGTASVQIGYHCM